MKSPCRHLSNGLLVLSLALALAGCGGGVAKKPEPVPQAPAEPVKPSIDSAQARVEFANALRAWENEELEEALARFAAFVESFPEAASAQYNSALIHLQLEQRELAIAALEAAVKTDPKLSRAWNELGILHREAGRFEQAETVYRKALAADPDNDRAHLNLGILYDLYLQQLDQALDHYQKYQSLQPQPDARVQGWIIDLARRLSVDLESRP